MYIVQCTLVCVVLTHYIFKYFILLCLYTRHFWHEQVRFKMWMKWKWNYSKYGGRSELRYIKQHLNKEVFPNLYKITQTTVTLPVSSAAWWRSFSTMKIITSEPTWTVRTNVSILNMEKYILIDNEIRN